MFHRTSVARHRATLNDARPVAEPDELDRLLGLAAKDLEGSWSEQSVERLISRLALEPDPASRGRKRAWHLKLRHCLSIGPK